MNVNWRKIGERQLKLVANSVDNKIRAWLKDETHLIGCNMGNVCVVCTWKVEISSKLTKSVGSVIQNLPGHNVHNGEKFEDGHESFTFKGNYDKLLKEC